MYCHQLLRATYLMLSLSATADTGTPFYGDPPNETHPWAVHDRNRPQPTIVTPGTPQTPGSPPSDATILFDGTETTLSNWVSDLDPQQPAPWIVMEGALVCQPGVGNIRTKEHFGDCQLHIEWASPVPAESSGQHRGNSGVFLMGEVEVQILDNYENPTYADGTAAAIYSTNPPMVNALRPSGQWQSYDIVFRRPIWQGDKIIDPGHISLFVNGVLAQDHTTLEGSSGYKTRPQPIPFPTAAPLKLQEHGSSVRFRNIWIRPLPARTAEGGCIGTFSHEATSAKRKVIAADIRADAGKLEGRAASLRLAESLIYELDPATVAAVTSFATNYANSVKNLTGDDASAVQSDAIALLSTLRYLVRTAAFPADLQPYSPLNI